MFFFKYTDNENEKNHNANNSELNQKTSIENQSEENVINQEETPKTNYIETLDKIEKDHIDLMERIAKPCRSTHERFTDVSKLDAIRKELEDSPYKETYDLGVTSIWTKVPLEELPNQILLVSSHIDVVPNITHCYSELNENGFLHGTYDNLATNAAEVIMMKEEDFPSNIVFAFNGDEETGGCAGAKEVAKKLTDMGKSVNLCVALDVTWEGFDDDKLFSLENLTYGKLGVALNEFVARSVLRIENDETDFCFIKANKHNIPTTFQKECPEVIEKSTGMYDEAFAYRDVGLPACSVCIPTEGDMHSNSGLYVKQPVFEGYILSLTSLLYSLCKEKEYLIESYKVARQNLVEKAKEIEFPKQKYYTWEPSNYSDGYNSNFYNYSDDIFSPDLSNKNWYIEEFEDIVPDLIEFADNYTFSSIFCDEAYDRIPEEYRYKYYENNGLDNIASYFTKKEEQEKLDSNIRQFLNGIYNEAQELKAKYNENYMGYINDDYDDYDDFPDNRIKTSYYEDNMIDTNNMEFQDWYVEEFSSLIPDLMELAEEYGPGCEEEFLSEVDIPQDYKADYVIYNYDSKYLSPEERQEVKDVCTNFLRGIYQTANYNYEEEYDEDELNDETEQNYTDYGDFE